MPATVLGNIVERDTSAKDSKENNSSVKSPQVIQSDVPIGFPKATHRSQSAFAKARANRNEPRPDAAPKIATAATQTTSNSADGKSVNAPSKEGGGDDGTWRKNMEQENLHVIEGMSDEQRIQERQDLISQFGPDLVNLVAKMRVARDEPSGIVNPPSRPRSAMAHSRTNTEESIPGNKAIRKLRFSERPDEVFVYESQPPSPKRVLALLPPPDPKPAADTATSVEEKENASGKLQWKFSKERDRVVDGDKVVDEHTPERIRERYFPDEPPPSENPTLAWMMSKNEEEPMASTPGPQHIRYDLQGRVIPPHLIHKLPAHLGLHHHGDRPEDAGYTLDELLMISRSTLPAQRAAMLQVLARLLQRLRNGEVEAEEKDNVSDISQKCLIVAIEAFGDRSSASVRTAGLEVIWSGIAVTQEEFKKTNTLNESTQLDTLPLSYLLSGTLFNFTRSSLTAVSQIKIYEILHGLVYSSKRLADEIIATAGLLDGAIRSSFALESSGEESRTMIDSVYLAALHFVQELASTSRKCAQSLIPDISDSFLRNIVLLPSSWKDSPQPSSLSVVAAILDFYTLLGRYGLGSSINTTTQDSFEALKTFVTTDVPFDIAEGQDLIRAWLNVHEAWIVCAIDPHQTTPEHDIRWSQVKGWGWSEALIALRQRMVVEKVNSHLLWAGWWMAWTRWSEGCRINEPDRGRRELEPWYEQSKSAWDEGGVERAVLASPVKQLQVSDIDHTGKSAAIALHAALHFIVEANSHVRLPTAVSGQELLDIIKNLLKDENWSRFTSNSSPTATRSWTSLLAVTLRTLRTLHPGTISRRALLNFQYNALQRLIPGDEMLAMELIADILDATQSQQNQLYGDASVSNEVWTTAGSFVGVLLPLYQYALWPDEELFIGPLVPPTRALKMTTTLSLPKQSALPRTPSGGLIGIYLPQKSPGDWMVAPLDIILRSGSTHTRLFRTLPPDWTASEIEVVRSVFLLLLNRRLPMTRSQIVLTCMKVFMLEHDQATQEGGEVYRDATVEKLMVDLLRPLRFSSTERSLLSSSNPTLDVVAKEFLGEEQPFHQFYSDLMGLYDSSSFGHQLFGELLLPPTSQLYPRDYRKLLWGDYSHVLRSIQIDAEEMFCDEEEIKTWLWPVEGQEDGEMLGFYLKSLLKNSLVGFPRFVAVHQTAYCLWPDLVGELDDRKRKSASQILKVILGSTDVSVLRDLLYYHQTKEQQSVILPPNCYTSQANITEARLKWAVEICGESARNHFPPL